MKKIFLLLLIVAVGSILWLNFSPGFNQNHTYTVVAGDCNYTLFDSNTKMQYFVSGESTSAIEQFTDKKVKVVGKIVQTTDTPEPTAKIFYNKEKVKSGECQVNPDIAIAAVKIDSIALAE